MTKLVYPSDGVYNSVSGYFSSCRGSLSNALNSCSFSIPSGFAYTNYVNGLYSQINSFVKEIDDIKAKVKDTDTRLDNLSESLARSVNSVPTSIIKENSRLIKF